MAKKSEPPLSLSDCLCQICVDILVEPVTLPCNHTLCNSCFQLTVENASLCCPFCRRRVSSWARYNARRNTLINWELWEKIQKHYPKECESRMNGQGLEEEIFVPLPQHQLSKPGELRQEYEAEISKVEAERRALEEEENKVSEEYIQRLLAEEEEENRLAEERRREMEKQLKEDEELAWQLSNSLVSSGQGGQADVLSSPSSASCASAETSPSVLCPIRRNKAKSHGDIQKYLFPSLPHRPGSASSSGTAQSGRRDPGSVDTNGNEGSSSVGEDEQEEMPMLSPLVTSGNKESREKDLVLESCTNYFSASDLGENSADKQEKTEGLNGLRDKVPDALHGIVEGEGSGTILCGSKGEEVGIKSDHGGLTHVERISPDISSGTCARVQSAASSVTSESKSGMWDTVLADGHLDEEKAEKLPDSKETPKRKSPEPPAEAALDLCTLDKRRRILPEGLEEQGEQINDANLEMQRAFEQALYERHVQEKQDWLLALQLQEQIDTEGSRVNRQKGSPDEYLLRTRTSRAVEDSPRRTRSSSVAKNSKGPKNQAESNRHKRKGSCNENWEPSPTVRMKTPCSKGGKVLNCVVNISDSKDLCSTPKTKQKTILQMFQGSVM
ncbi:RN168 ligase, partial [Centropus bengalensis]|nr:RN168 ligase [Centropus bengalensis]